MQGQSSTTLQKEGLIATCLHWALKVNCPRRYFVFDLNCGCGENRVNGANCLGTGPLVRNALREKGIEGSMWLCDVNRRSLKLAEKRFFNPQRHLFESGSMRDGIMAAFVRIDNRRFVPTIPQRIRDAGASPQMAQGVIIADPNGLHVPLREIGICLKETPKLDVIIHICSLKQVSACKAKNPTDPRMNLAETVVRSCSEIFSTIPRNTWLISEPFRAHRGREHHVFYGSDMRWVKPIINLPGRPNMHRIDSPEGCAVIADADRFAEVA